MSTMVLESTVRLRAAGKIETLEGSEKMGTQICHLRGVWSGVWRFLNECVPKLED
jgi:hypothetical protein